eukprot:scaffold358688_cov37-Prasinocladus_malaysianus.AAC.1
MWQTCRTFAVTAPAVLLLVTVGVSWTCRVQGLAAQFDGQHLRVISHNHHDWDGFSNDKVRKESLISGSVYIQNFTNITCRGKIRAVVEVACKM